MPAKKESLSNALLDAVLRNVAYSSPAAVYAACFTAAPTATTAGTEVSDGGGTLYARQAVTFGAAASGSCSNSGAVTFPAAGAAWGTVTSAGICSGSTVGVDDVLYFGNLSESKVVGIGDQLQFAIGALVVTEN
jgi:hypothetical protein